MCYDEIVMKTIAVGLIVLGVFGGVIYLAYNQWQQQNKILSNPKPTQRESRCQRDTDCALGIKPSACCACPQGVNYQILGQNGWLPYTESTDISSGQKQACNGNTDSCEKCLPVARAVCYENRCLAMP